MNKPVDSDLSIFYSKNIYMYDVENLANASDAK